MKSTWISPSHTHRHTQHDSELVTIYANKDFYFFLFLHFARKSNKAYGNFICFYAFLTSNCLSVFRVVRGDYTFLPCEAEKRSQTGCLYSVCLPPSIETMKYHKHSHNGGKKKQTWHQLYWYSVKYLLYSQCGRIELDIIWGVLVVSPSQM